MTIKVVIANVDLKKNKLNLDFYTTFILSSFSLYPSKNFSHVISWCFKILKTIFVVRLALSSDISTVIILIELFFILHKLALENIINVHILVNQSYYFQILYHFFLFSCYQWKWSFYAFSIIFSKKKSFQSKNSDLRISRNPIKFKPILKYWNQTLEVQDVMLLIIVRS